jgi:hypothetical protein
MKRNDFIKTLLKNNIIFFRSGLKNDIYRNRKTGKKISVPRLGEIDTILAKEILKELRII